MFTSYSIIYKSLFGIYQILFSKKASAFYGFSLFLLAEFVVQHYITPDHRIRIGNLVKNVFYLFHNVILSFLVNNT